MSHFTVLVTGDDIEAALAPYDEGLDVEPYLDTDWNADDEYEWAKVRAVNDDNDRKPDNLDLADRAAVYRWFFEDKGIVLEGGQWVRYSTYNPKSKWDWYSVGGRWAGELKTKDGHGVNETSIGDLDLDNTNPTYAVLHDGQWVARGEMGWFGFSKNSTPEDEWPRQWRSFIKSLPSDTRAVLIDAHI